MLFQVDYSVDLDTLDTRINDLDRRSQQSSHVRKEKSLYARLVNFLNQLPHKPNLQNVSPQDIRRFLVWLDRFGKTQVHDQSCDFIGKSGISNCSCRVAFSASTLKITIIQLRNILNKNGRGDTWNEYTQTGNPVLSDVIKQHIKVISAEQSQARILPKQAKPIFVSKLRKISLYIKNQYTSFKTHLSMREKYVLQRDQSLFKLQFFAGDRASDMSNILTQEIKLLADNSGLVFCHTYGKCLRGGDGKRNCFVIKRCTDKLICPVSGLEEYLNYCKRWHVNLSNGYLFRQVTENNIVLDASVSYSLIYERLKTYLRLLGIDNGETPHSLRAGCAVTMALAKDSNPSDIMNHIGWSSPKMADYYSRATKLHDSAIVATSLSDAVNDDEVERFYIENGNFDLLPPLFC